VCGSAARGAVCYTRPVSVPSRPKRPHARAALLALLLLAAPAARGRCPRPSDEHPPARPGAFDCAAAATTLGQPTAKVAFCQELLSDLWRVVLAPADPTAPWTTHRFVTERGAIVSATGLPALEAYLRRTRLAQTPWLDPLAVAELLQATATLPPGFGPDTLTAGLDPRTGQRSSVRTRPLVITLYHPTHPERATLTETPAGRLRWTLHPTADASP
jgi:hypothetical protein